jgi:YD repeat-containing protein
MPVPVDSTPLTTRFCSTNNDNATNMKTNPLPKCTGFLLLAALGHALASTVSYTYDPAGRLITADYGGGKSASYAYDNAGNLLQSSTPAPGLIIGPLVSGQFTLSWPATPGGFVLQSAGSIGPSAVWNNVGLTPVLTGNLYSVILTPATPATFYRLKK